MTNARDTGIVAGMKKCAASKKVERLMGAHRDGYGEHRKVRLDIKETESRLKRGKQGILAIHKSPPGTTAPGKVVGYDDSVVLRDVKFVVGKRGQHLVGNRLSKKFPFAYTSGTLVNEKAVAGGTPIQFNPHREHLFVDMKTKRPVRGASRVVHIGGKTYAFKPEYYGRGEAPAPPDGFKNGKR